MSRLVQSGLALQQHRAVKVRRLSTLATTSTRSHPKQIKIVHIINDLNIGGAEMMLCKLMSQLNRNRFDPVVVSLRKRGQLHERLAALNVPVFSVAMRLPLPTPTSTRRLIKLIREIEPDLIQGWMYHGNLGAQIAAAFLSRTVPVVWNIRQSLHGADYEKRLTAALIKLSAYLSNRPDKIIYNSRIAAAQHNAIGYSARESIVIPNGFATDLFLPSLEARRSVRTELGVNEETILIGLVGRYHPVKDHSNFLHAAPLVLQRHPNVQFVLCGRGVNRLNDDLCRLIEELKLAERVHLMDQRKDMPRITAGLDIATSSSSAESFPNVVGEAMSCGVPCVVTDVSDLAWIVGESGRVVPPKNPEALAAAIQELIELGPDRRKALGKAARERVINHFPLDQIEARYEALYEAILSQQPERYSSSTRYRDIAESPTLGDEMQSIKDSSECESLSLVQ
jgi:glycosyltransferase involved in cell wall biosynthesis